MKMYEARPGHWLCEGVSWEDHRAAMAANWDGDWWEYELQQDAVERLIAANDEAGLWITKDDRAIPYRDLEPEHLENIVKMLKRKHKTSYFPNLIKHWETTRAS